MNNEKDFNSEVEKMTRMVEDALKSNAEFTGEFRKVLRDLHAALEEVSKF